MVPHLEVFELPQNVHLSSHPCGFADPSVHEDPTLFVEVGRLTEEVDLVREPTGGTGVSTEPWQACAPLGSTLASDRSVPIHP